MCVCACAYVRAGMCGCAHARAYVRACAEFSDAYLLPARSTSGAAGAAGAACNLKVAARARAFHCLRREVHRRSISAGSVIRLCLGDVWFSLFHCVFCLFVFVSGVNASPVHVAYRKRAAAMAMLSCPITNDYLTDVGVGACHANTAVKYARGMLASGFDSDAVQALASLGTSSYKNVERDLHNTVKEVRRAQCGKDYANFVAKRRFVAPNPRMFQHSRR